MTFRLLCLVITVALIETYATGGQAPTISTGTPSDFTSTSVTIYGAVNPNGLSTTWYWEWGTTTAYGSILYPWSAGGQTTAISITSVITGLTPDTTYHYQLVASNSAGVTFGGDQSFTTPTAEEQVFTYAIHNNTVTVTGYSGKDGTVVIPGIIAQLPVVSIGNSAFSGMSGLTNVTISGSVTSIGAYAFAYCSGLTSVTIPVSVTNILGNAFWGCAGLTNVTIPDSVSWTGDHVFADCANLRSATIESPSVGDYAFSGCSNLVSVAIGNSVTTIGGQAFENCTSLTSLIIPDNVRTIKDGNNSWWVEGAFGFCTNLTNVIIGAGVTNIGDNAFYACTSLTTLTIPDGVGRIGYHAFLGCTGLTNIIIGNGVTNIAVDDDSLAPYSGTPFYGCTNLITIAVGSLNTSYSSLDGVLFDKSQGQLVICPGGRAGSFIIPSSVTNIAEQAFFFCVGLTNITIPSTVISIGYRAFAYCAGLAAVTIGNDVTDIGDSAFYYCTGLTAIIVPNSVTNIAELAFAGCTNLTNLTLGNSVANIGEGAFAGCSDLASLTIPSSVFEIADSAFANCSSLQGIYFEGNAPGVAFCDCFFVVYGTVYYLPDTTGWGTTFGGHPTALWNPRAQAGDASFGVRLKGFGFNIAGTADIPLVIEGSTDLAARSWVPLQSCTLTNGLIYFSDLQWTNFPSRSYRIRSP